MCWRHRARRTGALVGGRARTAPPAGPAPGCSGQCVSLSLPEAGLEGRWLRAKALAQDQGSDFRVHQQQRGASVTGSRLSPSSQAVQRASGHGSTLELMAFASPRQSRAQGGKDLSNLAGRRERTQWNLLPEDAHSDLGRESNSRTEAFFFFFF